MEGNVPQEIKTLNIITLCRKLPSEGPVGPESIFGSVKSTMLGRIPSLQRAKRTKQ